MIMVAPTADTGSDEGREPRWGLMLGLSLAFHVVVFALILFVPDYTPARRITGEVYEVHLVEMPTAQKPRKSGPSRRVTPDAKARPAKEAPDKKNTTPARRIPHSAKKEKPVVIAKKTLAKKERPPEKSKKPEIAPSKLIEEAISEIEARVRKEPEPQPAARDRKTAEVERPSPNLHPGRPVGRGGGADTGILFRMYVLRVEDWIKGNWSYVPLSGSASKNELEAVMSLKVRQNGKIMDIGFLARSGNSRFDESVLRAIERSDPLPAFPPGYRKTHEEFEINFNLSELEG